MEIDFGALEPSQRYATMIRAITPRPIAWVSTISPQGITNLAPFSFFSGVGSSPPALLFSVVDKNDGSPKDTMRNVEATGEFVVNIVPFNLRQPMAVSSKDYPYEDSEFERAGLTAVPSKSIRPPRVAESPVNFECRLHEIVRVGTANVVFGIVLWLHLDDSILDTENKIDPDLLDSIGRMGGLGYTRTTQRFDLK